MAHDERDSPRGREPGWRGDDSFGGGWGNQVPRPHRLGDRSWRGQDDVPDYGAGGWYGPGAADGDHLYGDPGRYREAGEARFRRAGLGDFGHDIGTAGMARSSARAFAIARHDPHYADWRDRQIAELDRDYEDRGRALFEREDLGRRGPHVLNRSFAGTYPDEE